MSDYCQIAISGEDVNFIPTEAEMSFFKPYCKFLDDYNNTNNDIYLRVDDDGYFISHQGIGKPGDINKCQIGEGIHHYTVILDRTAQNPGTSCVLTTQLPYHHNTGGSGERVFIYVYDQSEATGKTKGVSKSAIPIKRDTGKK